MRFLGLFLLLITGLQASELLVEREYSRGTTIEVIAPFNILPDNGFFPLRVETTNKTASELTWSIDVQTHKRNRSYAHKGDAPLIEARFQVKCPAGESKVAELLVPIHQGGNDTATQDGEQYLSLSVKSSSEEGRTDSGFFSRTAAVDMENFVVSDVLTQMHVPDMVENAYGRSYYREEVGGSFEVAYLPQDWRAYAGYNSLVFARADYLKISPMVKVALEQWVQGGGSLIILNDGGVLPQDEFPMEGEPNLVIREGFGNRQVIECGSSFKDFKAKELIDAFDLGSRKTAESAQLDYSWNNDWVLGKELGNRSLQTSLILIALIIFGIVVGPVNLFVWADKTRRHRLFYTTPLISLVMCILLIGIIVIRDGFGGDGTRAIAIDVGRPGGNSASILQEQFSRTGILFSSTFEIDEHAVINAVHAPVSEYNLADSNSAQAVVSYDAKSKGKGWEFSGDWFESRAEQAQVVRSVFPSRERLEFIQSVDGKPRLVSSFSYSLENVYYRGEDGEVWSAQSIAPGETVTLVRSTVDKQREDAGRLVARFGDTHQRMLRNMIERPGSFSAQAVGTPVIETYKSVDWQSSPALITGLLK